MSDKSSGKSFLLCVGAQKAGTTWLHRYLEQHNNVYLGFMKEYHVFDALTLPSGEAFFRKYIGTGERRLKRIQRELRGETTKARSLQKNVFKMLDFLSDYNNYFDYFSSILHTKKDIYLTGDITPAYCTLEPEVLELIRKNISDRGISIKVVYLMRDPVERCISASQFTMGLKNENGESEESTIDDINEFVRKDYKRISIREKTRYDLTIKNLESVFSRENLYYEFSERLFTTEGVENISKFLGIESRHVDFDEKINESRIKFSVSNDVRAEIYSYYSPVYEFMYDRYSRDFIHSIWKSYDD